jgi:hypothetical protein
MALDTYTSPLGLRPAASLDTAASTAAAIFHNVVERMRDGVSLTTLTLEK